MKIETYLSAMTDAVIKWNMWNEGKHFRQFHAFRVRILMKFDAKEMLIQLQHMKISSQRERIAEYRKEIIEKDEEIRVLEKSRKDHDDKTILDYMENFFWGETK